MLKALLLFLAAMLTCAATPCVGQPPGGEPPAVNRRGLHIGIDPLTYATLTSDYVTGGRRVGGMGLQLRFGWGFTEHLSLVLDVSVTELGVADTANYFLSNGDVMLRYTPTGFAVGRRTVIPYIGAGIGLRENSTNTESPTAEDIYVLEGEVLALSAGASVYLQPNLSAFLGYHGGFGDFMDERIGNLTTHNRKLRGDSHRVAVGMTWYKGRGR